MMKSLMTLLIILMANQAFAIWPFGDDVYDTLMTTREEHESGRRNITKELKSLPKDEQDIIRRYIQENYFDDKIKEGTTIGDALEYQREVEAQRANRKKTRGEIIREGALSGWGMEDVPCPELLVKSGGC